MERGPMNARRIALVTGANKGLGFETARQLAEKGILVLMGCRSVSRGRAAVKAHQNEGLPVEFIRLDVTKPEQIENVSDVIKKRFGKLDILVNNAGTSLNEDRSSNRHGASFAQSAQANV